MSDEAKEPEAGGSGPVSDGAAPQSAERPEPHHETPITLDDFARIDLRVARIRQAEPHPKADRLLKLQIDLGGEQRQLVAGIAPWYRPEDLAGRLIIVVANLKPARLRGELSEGMLLAASDGDLVSILSPDADIAPGSRIR